ncbi:MAG: hypothetical protein JXA73_13840 [Acidobacteria bacterium]|nr:hypothetical protein [Acidobacteriota bacterium]
MQNAEEPILPTDPDKSESPTPAERASASEAPEFTILQRRPWMIADLVRVFLILLSLAAAGVLVLIFMPQTALDTIVQDLQARHQVASPEQIAFLYLGDEIADNAMHIRGVVRNITAVPIEQLDALVRFYSYDRILLETTVVRMSKETIGPGEIAQFELVYPNYQNEFAGYSIEFKLRQGSLVPYKDLRTIKAQSD